jgi:hypothetical protein
VAGVGACEGCAEALQLVVGERCFDHREELSLLEADVALEPLAEFAQRRRFGIRVGLEILTASTQIQVLCQHSHDLRPGELGVACVGRQQQLLLAPEVTRALPA